MFSFEKTPLRQGHLALSPVMMMREGDRIVVVDPRSKSISRFTEQSFEALLSLDGKEWPAQPDNGSTADAAFVKTVSALGLVHRCCPEDRVYVASKIRDVLHETRGIARRTILNPPALPTVNINEQCRFRCWHCYNSRGSTVAPEMTKEVIVENVLKPLARLGCANIMWCGGDPVTTPNKTIDCTAVASDLGISAATQVADFSRAFLGNFAAAGGRGIQVSLYSSPDHPEIDDRFRRQRGSWKMAVENIEEARRNDLAVFVNMVLFPENVRELTRTAEFAYKLGVSTFRTTVPVIVGRARHNERMLTLSNGHMESLLEEAATLQESFSGRMGILTDISERGRPSDLPFSFCSAGMTYMHVAGYDVFPCNFMMDSRFRMGSVRKQGADDIWRESVAVRPFRLTEPLHDKCRKCTRRESAEFLCTDCKAVMWRRYGSYLNPDTVACGDERGSAS